MIHIFKKTIRSTAAVLAIGFAVSIPTISHAGPDAYVGELMAGGWNFCPRGTARADGQLLPISSNTALFSLLGTQFGGDGRTSFGLPDLRGRIPMHNGAGPGLPSVSIGQRGGATQTAITTAQMPSHTHDAFGTSDLVSKAGPRNALLGPTSITPPVNMFSRGAPNRQMKAGMIGNTGGSAPVSIQNPYVGITWCIATQGIFPSRN